MQRPWGGRDLGLFEEWQILIVYIKRWILPKCNGKMLESFERRSETIWPRYLKDHSHSLWRTGYTWIIMEQCELLRHCYSDPDKGPWQCVGRPLRWWEVSRFSLIFDTELEVRVFRICCGLHVRSPTKWGIRAIPCLCPEQLDGAVAILGGSDEGGKINKKSTMEILWLRNLWKIELEILSICLRLYGEIS